MNKLYIKRFEELFSQSQIVENSKKNEYSEYSGNYVHINEDLFLNWTVKVKNLLVKTCGEDSIHFKSFNHKDMNHDFAENYSSFKALKAIFLAAQEDYLGGYTTSLKELIQAEIFDDELEQASELLKCDYLVPSAVIVGVVLETALRDKCKDLGLQIGMIDQMNVNLAKAGVYDKLKQKRITVLADLRNKAAHGNSTFNKSDVERMLSETMEIIGSLKD